nr:hypothetical protein CFP56_19380 [Quercus suber]
MADHYLPPTFTRPLFDTHTTTRPNIVESPRSTFNTAYIHDKPLPCPPKQDVFDYRKPAAPLSQHSFPASSRPTKRLSPGLQLRLARLHDQRRRLEFERQRQDIGRIPEHQLAVLEHLQRHQETEICRLGRTWTGHTMPAGGVRLDGGPVLSDAEASMLESDVSSIIDVSDNPLMDSEDEHEGHDAFVERQKFRMPDGGKTRLHLHTKEPLSPTARQVPAQPAALLPRRTATSTPTTPSSATASNAPSISRQHSGFGGADYSRDLDFVSNRLSRAGSIYTLSRVSLAAQLSQLTSMHLPDANSLAKRISEIPTSKQAAKILSDASEQIRVWIKKASEVLSGLDAEDDAEWAAAGGTDGIEDVDKAIGRFGRLVQVYISSIERLQAREDVAALAADELKETVDQMEDIVISWQKVRDTLNGIKIQVEIAMEWEELWNSVLGEIGQEMEGLNRMVFEMEEKRHQGAESLLTSKDSIDLAELEIIVDERSQGNSKHLKDDSFSLTQFSQAQPAYVNYKDDASLLALFARMQPMRASLDFLPMRLAVFHARGNAIFPSACHDLDHRRDHLERQWRKLEVDAESLRRELGEDRWILVFRNAGKQAWKMCESITRSFEKLKASIDAGEQHSGFLALQKKIENYEAKKTHYGPAIERVLAIIDKGVADRLTVNGEVLRLQSDIKTRWTSLQTEMQDVDVVLKEISDDARDKQLRDSVSTVVSSERSLASSIAETPGSSPASSVMGDSRKNSFGSRTPTPLSNVKIRHNGHDLDNGSVNRRRASGNSSIQESTSSIPRPGRSTYNTKITLVHKTSMTLSTPGSSPGGTRTSSMSTTRPARPEAPLVNRPRWVTIAKSEDKGFLPLSALEPSPYAKAPITPRTNFLRSSRTSTTPTTPLSAPALRSTRNVSTPLPPSSIPRISLPASNRKSSLPLPAMTVTPVRHSSPLTPKITKSGLRPTHDAESSSSRTKRHNITLSPSSAPVVDGNEADSESPSHHHHSRAPSAMSGRRSSMMPSRAGSWMDGDKDADRPMWRP